jgi:metal-responsive CopG/Arc/MetJ family transcriptional regulator
MISVRLDNSLENELNHIAQEQQISKSKIIKNSLIYYFEMLKEKSKEKSSYELGASLFGKYSSGDSNLSTTYKQKLKDKLNAKNNHR